MAVSVTLVKSFAYRGVQEQWSNRYHLTGANPTGPTEWKTLVDAIRDLERPTVGGNVTYVGAYGYLADGASSVYQLNYADPPNTVVGGTFVYTPGSAQFPAPGDAALWVRWATTKRNTKGRPVYARKYYHSIILQSADVVLAAQRTLFVTMAGKLTDGTLPNARVLCLPDGTLAGTIKVPTFVTTRTLKRRGPDPS